MWVHVAEHSGGGTCRVSTGHVEAQPEQIHCLGVGAGEPNVHQHEKDSRNECPYHGLSCSDGKDEAQSRTSDSAGMLITTVGETKGQ